MPKKTDHPIPKIRFHGDRWRIYWYWNKRQYSIATPHTDPKTDPKKSNPLSRDFRLVSSALAMDVPAFPTEYENDPSVIAYVKARSPEPDPVTSLPQSNEDWLNEYAKEIKAECDASWAKMSLTYLSQLNKATGLTALTPKDASIYLADIAEKRKISTRNRHLAIYSRFYKWAILTERTKINPFAGIKYIKEKKSSKIIYCTLEERAEIIAMAEATGWGEWIAVPLAFYSGMRREEVANCMWPDIRFDTGLITVNETKTEKPREIPLNPTLEKYLKAVPESERKGHIVKVPTNINRLYRMDNLLDAIRRTKEEAMLSELNIKKPLPSRSKRYREEKVAYKEAMEKHAPDIEEALKIIGWNAFRHTFGSLYAQAGVSIDKISNWMGNTAEVCRRHYAQFVPKHKRDSDIDLVL